MIHRSTAEVRVIVADETETRGLFVVNIRGTTEIAAARNAAGNAAALLLSVSDCVVLGYKIVYKTIIQEATSGNDIDKPDHALFIFNTNVDEEYGVVVLPEIAAHLILPDNEIDTTNSDVSAFVDEMINGLWCSPFGNDLTELEATLYEVKP